MIENINTNWNQIIENYEQENNINFEQFINDETEKYKDAELNIFPKKKTYLDVLIILMLKKLK